MEKEKSQKELEIYQQRYIDLKEKNNEYLRLQKKLHDLKVERDRISLREAKARIKYYGLREHLSRLDEEIRFIEKSF